MGDLRTRIVAAIEAHGEESGPEYMLGDMEEVLDAVLGLLTGKQLRAVEEAPAIAELLDSWAPEEDFDGTEGQDRESYIADDEED